jgi:hypothetical protein
VNSHTWSDLILKPDQFLIPGKELSTEKWLRATRKLGRECIWRSDDNSATIYSLRDIDRQPLGLLTGITRQRRYALTGIFPRWSTCMAIHFQEFVPKVYLDGAWKAASAASRPMQKAAP